MKWFQARADWFQWFQARACTCVKWFHARCQCITPYTVKWFLLWLGVKWFQARAGKVPTTVRACLGCGATGPAIVWHAIREEADPVLDPRPPCRSGAGSRPYNIKLVSIHILVI